MPYALCFLLALSAFANRLHLTDTYTAEGANIADINGDGAADIICGPWWYAGPDFAAKHEIYPPKAFPNNRGYADNFFNWPHDFDADGDPDILVVGLPGTPAFLYLNPGAEEHWPKHEVHRDVGNESPTFADIDVDGQPDLICMSGGRAGYASYDPAAPTTLWTFHPITAGGGRFTHGLGVGDVDGDGRPDLLTHNSYHTRAADSASWTRHPANFGRGGAQMFADDIDGDGDADIISSIAAHGWGLSWFEQTSPGQFREHRVMTEKPADSPYELAFSQPHALELIDIDGDGHRDIVTGKCYFAHNGGDPGAHDPAVLYWFRRTKVADAIVFEPHRIDTDSG
ncbi:MAG: hypothetical protein ACI8W8_003521, partial [Rhodothermales bacterium]